MELPRAPLLLKICALAVAVVTAFFLGLHWSSTAKPLHLLFFSPGPTTSVSISISPNAAVSFDLSSLIPNQAQIQTLTLTSPSPPPAPPISPPPPPPPPPPPFSFGIVDENGTMTDEFQVGDFGSDLDEGWEFQNETLREESEQSSGRIWVRKYRSCNSRMVDYVPCMDNEEEVGKLKMTERGERFERHCPKRGLNCLIPVPKGYKVPIPWPRSRDEVWFSNVPHTQLVKDKGGQNWISRERDKFKFPGGGTQFIHGADQYLNQISQMVLDIGFGKHTKVALDVGCGVASFGAFLFSRNVITLSIAPKDVHENQIQFALERGVPAMIAAFATHRLPYPSQAFDLIHCSRCRINWTRDDGILLLEVNRMLRAGGYFVWAAQPVYKHEDKQQEEWKDMEDLTNRICWVLVKKEGYIAIWRKPLNNTCYINRGSEVQPPLCDVEDDPNSVWYVSLKACISRLPDNGTEVPTWPARVYEPPERLQSIKFDAYISKNELFKAESRYWKEIVEAHIRIFHWKKWKLRNVMDMRAGFGGFAAALIDHNIDSWVMNVVPISGPNTLPVVYDRGLIGVNHDWCEPFDTYPRTYDFLHASGLFSREQRRCNISIILLEMDRILRPGGRAYIHDTKFIIDDIQEISKAMGWRTDLRETPDGWYATRRILLCQKLRPR